MDSDCSNKFLAISRMPGHAEMHIPLNFLEHFIRSRCHDVLLPKQLCCKLPKCWDELLFPISSLINDTTVNLFPRYVK